MTNIHNLRALFVDILVYNQVHDPFTLWDTFKEDLGADLLHTTQASRPNATFDEVQDDVLHKLANLLLMHGTSNTLEKFHLPTPARPPSQPIPTELMQEFQNHSIDQAQLDDSIASMNVGQTCCFNAFSSAVRAARRCRGSNDRWGYAVLDTTPRLFYWNAHGTPSSVKAILTCAPAGPQLRLFYLLRMRFREPYHSQHVSVLALAGGTGKTWTMNLCANFARSFEGGSICLAVASSGIAATLLGGGTTAHYRFKVPVPCDQHSSCNVSSRTENAQLIRESLAIVWDEAPMTSKYVLQAVDRSLQHLMGNTLPFGGKVIVLAGETFLHVCQVLPPMFALHVHIVCSATPT